MQLNRLAKAMLLSSTLTLLASCGSDKKEEPVIEEPVLGKSIDLKILHINDHHSHLQPNTGMDLVLDGETIRVEIGGFPRIVSKMNELTNGEDNVLKLHAGDAISGDLYYTLFNGEADAEMMNQVCFDAFALGNHEFDAGDTGLRKFLEFLYSPTCQTEILAANVVPEIGVSDLTPNSADNYIKPYMIKEFEGEKVAVIGIDIANKTKNSSSPDESTQFLDELATAQSYIDQLKADGINKIILLTHYQFDNDLALASSLNGVDIIVGGDSHTLLGDVSELGLNSQGDYPSMTVDAAGKTVCVVQAWQYAAVVGELNVSFDGNGDVTSCGGNPHLLLGDTFKRKDDSGNPVELDGEARQTVLDQIAATDELSIVAEDFATATRLEYFADSVETMKQTVIGFSSDYLCLERIPGQGKSALCDVSATAAQGSDISNIVALAFKEQSLTADISIQNAGGVRVDIAAGDLTMGDAYLLLPFANTLVNLEMTGAEIKQVLEEAVDYALAPDGSSGAYPYASGLRFDVYSGNLMGNRVLNIEVKLKGETEWHAIDETISYSVVTNNYTAGGKDGYLTFGDVSNDGRITDTYLDYAQSFVDYVKRVGGVSKLESSEYSTQHFYDADGNLQL